MVSERIIKNYSKKLEHNKLLLKQYTGNLEAATEKISEIKAEIVAFISEFKVLESEKLALNSEIENSKSIKSHPESTQCHLDSIKQKLGLVNKELITLNKKAENFERKLKLYTNEGLRNICYNKIKYEFEKTVSQIQMNKAVAKIALIEIN